MLEDVLEGVARDVPATDEHGHLVPRQPVALSEHGRERDAGRPFDELVLEIDKNPHRRGDIRLVDENELVDKLTANVESDGVLLYAAGCAVR